MTFWNRTKDPKCRGPDQLSVVSHVKCKIANMEIKPISDLYWFVDLVGIHPEIEAVSLDGEDSIIKKEAHLPNYIKAPSFTLHEFRTDQSSLVR